MSDAPRLDYMELQNALLRAGALGSAAEVDGTLCGALSGGGSQVADLWLVDALQNTDMDNTQRQAVTGLLRDLQLKTWGVLAGSGVDFTPLLPPDEADLGERVVALTEWCSGFLYGLSLAGVVEQQFDRADTGEIIRDISEIARAAPDDDADIVEQDFAFAELVEYLRVGAQLIFEELAPFRERPDMSRSSH